MCKILLNHNDTNLPPSFLPLVRYHITRGCNSQWATVMSYLQRLSHWGTPKSLTTFSHHSISTFSPSFTTELGSLGHALLLILMNFGFVGCYLALVRNKMSFFPFPWVKITSKLIRGLSIIQGQATFYCTQSAHNRDRWVNVCATTALSCLEGEQWVTDQPCPDTTGDTGPWHRNISTVFPNHVSIFTLFGGLCELQAPEEELQE